jgi:hypothetical protein
MSSGNWFDRQPDYVRLFLGIVAAVALLLALVLSFVITAAPEWVPEDSLVPDTLVPPADEGAHLHFTPDTLKLRSLDALTPAGLPTPYSVRWRAGVSVPDDKPLYFDWPPVRPGWYLNWDVNLVKQPGLLGLSTTSDMELPDPLLGMEFTPMVRMRSGRLHPPTADLREMAAQHPGLTWLIGNEPDVKWQDNTPPEVYAVAYHRAYKAIKAGDPTAKVAIGGLSQITPLRLQYLDRVWDFYQSLYGEEMPVDVWNMHAFVLREERSAWGVNIPPGFEIEQRGELWEVEDHDNLDLVEAQIRAMRQWMAEHGQRDKPLWITEYGILMPQEYGFDAARVTRFMLDSFALFLNLRDHQFGYPEDDNRLVQRWNWYPARDSRFSAGNLFDDYGRVTPVGQAMFDYLAAAEEPTPDAAPHPAAP